jgi:hypothetical protein
LGIFKIGSGELFAWDLLQIVILLISASWVGMIISMSHWCLASLNAVLETLCRIEEVKMGILLFLVFGGMKLAVLPLSMIWVVCLSFVGLFFFF